MKRPRFWSVKKILLALLVLVLGLGIGLCVYATTSMGRLRVVIPKAAEITGLLRGDRTYLILLQNNAELRPTGGFITAFGELTFRAGIPTGLQVRDVYSLKGYDDAIIEEAPYPMGDMLQDKDYHGYNFHDANWYPDLPTSAKDLLRFYDQEFPGKKIDGLVLVNFSVVEDFMELLGSLPYKGKEIPANELFNTIEYEQNNIDRHNIEDITTRKSILSELLPVFVKRLTADWGRLPEISEHIVEHLDKKNITVWMADPSLENFFVQQGWANIFPKPDAHRDIFAVIFANLGGMKSDRYLEKEVSHTVQVTRLNESTDQRRIVATTRVHLSHLGDYNAPLSHVYRGFIRVVIPKEAKLLEIDPAVYDIYEEQGYTMVGRKVTLEPKQSLEYEFSYELPATIIENNTYKVALYRQSGIENISYATHLMVPQDQLLSSEDFVTRENVASLLASNITTDRLLTAKIGTDTTPPRVSFQEFVDYNKLTIQFNEPVVKSDCENIENYQVRDSDKEVPNQTNNPSIIKVTCKDREATIFTRNIRTQYGEHFTVTLRNIRDWSNNILSPNPRDITVVQRMEKDAPKK